ncbi:HolB ATPase involved in DNA replication [uncultured Caudovirales phage]|uniref:Sliding-clamp-loader large subunit n=1 Tax=uncultured Caudovirales phage TaxID=2100421 RepID=A0A6J5TAT4_9CAUD|nr:HolB ATPase involved in DNA replication [uncultured Caudovirales phage]
MKELWVEKYRPKDTNDYVWIDKDQKHMVETWIKDKYIPHLLLAGAAGAGKTTLAKILINELGVDPAEFMHINASRDNGVDTLRLKIGNFCSTMSMGPFKVVLLDEADYITPAAQAILRGMMEQYHEGVRFILTCNYPNKIIPALHSRLQTITFRTLDETDFTRRLATILVGEGVDLDGETLQMYVKACYPDLRKAINTVQMRSTSGKLEAPKSEDAESDYKLAMVDLFRQGRLREARNLIIKQITLEEYEDMFRFMYRNLDLWGKDEDTQDQALLLIRKGLVNHGLVADAEINLSATFVELERLYRG